MTALVVIIVVLAVAVVGLALLYRSQGEVVDRQRKHNNLLRTSYAADFNRRAKTTAELSRAPSGLRDLEGLLSQFLPCHFAAEYRYETSHEVAPGCFRITITSPERASEPSCVSCADLGLEGGCRVCGQ